MGCIIMTSQTLTHQGAYQDLRYAYVDDINCLVAELMGNNTLLKNERSGPKRILEYDHTLQS